MTRIYNFMKSFFFSQNDSDVNAENEIHARTAPISFQRGATIDDVQSLVLAAEGMVVCRFKNINILSAVVTLLASYCVFNADYFIFMVVIERMCIYFLSTFCCKGADMHC